MYKYALQTNKIIKNIIKIEKCKIKILLSKYLLHWIMCFKSSDDEDHEKKKLHFIWKFLSYSYYVDGIILLFLSYLK